MTTTNIHRKQYPATPISTANSSTYYGGSSSTTPRSGSQPRKPYNILGSKNRLWTTAPKHTRYGWSEKKKPVVWKKNVGTPVNNSRERIERWKHHLLPQS